MSSSKNKNLLIIMLLLLDAILLAIVLFDNAESREVRQAEADAICQVLSMNGITVEEGVVFDISAPQPCVVFRDDEKEQELISKIIGSCSRKDLGGNIIFYESDKGQALFRGDGEVDIIFMSDFPEMDAANAKAAAKYMRKCGLTLDASTASIADSGVGSELVLTNTVDDCRVYNAKLSFTISGGQLSIISGNTVFTGQRSYSDEEVIDSTTAMMRFIEIVHDEGYICSKVKSVETGYFMSVSVSGECILTPVWRIETDTNVFHINAVSGKLETLTT